MFEPGPGLSESDVIYARLCELDVGDVLGYGELDEMLGREFRRSRSPFYVASRRYGRARHRALVPVPNVGYRVVDAPEHELIARKHHKKSRRSLNRSRFAVETADRSRLSAEDVRRFDELEQTIARQQDMIRRLDLRQGRVEKTLEVTAERQSVSEARLAELEAAMRRHGLVGQ